ncbi:tRNA-splicing endonuclease subunit sen54 N-term-domain-containing protein [Scheffersomyces xylosifermentans]|uniref:tRNA-splicing endonuclease subunit sen54 N-term-domain-containing protein n=1 Tax=Scheffersomyces xylosifermentans TaxID=1304137 RepID=UPI00315D6479
MAEERDEAVITKDEANFDVEDEVQDWKLLNKSLTSGTGIPKRGEKEFEPDGTNVQIDSLQESRNAMYEALSGVRGHHLKQKLVGVWDVENGRCIVPHAKGNYFRDVGVPVNIGNKIRGGMSLNPLETVYLVERGSMVIYLGNEVYSDFLQSNEDGIEFDYDQLVALDLEFLYSLAFNGKEYSIEKYQVYAYLKRLGYLVQQFKPIGDKDQRTKLAERKTGTSLVNTIFGYVDHILKKNRLFEVLKSKLHNWGILAAPLFHGLHFATKHYFNFTDVFKSLSLIQSYSTYDSIKEDPQPSENYDLTFNVWRPTPTFSKKNPPLPDFQVSVVNTDVARFPNLETIQALHNRLNFQFKGEEGKTVIPRVKVVNKKKSSMPPSKKELRYQRQKERQSKLDEAIQKRNQYNKVRDNKLKYGSDGRTVVIATVNNGVLNFINITEGDFKLQKNMDLDDIYPGNDHGIIYIEST